MHFAFRVSHPAFRTHRPRRTIIENPNLVLLPGLLNDASLFEQQADALADVAGITIADLTGADLFEAARIDGASAWLRVRRIMLPLAKRALLMATVISIIGSMLAFDQFYLMTGGGPRAKTFTSVYMIYQSGFVRFDLGYAAALSVMLMLVIMAITAIQLRLQSLGGRE